MKQRTIVIAEIGVNHNGNLKNGFKLIDFAKKAGADFVKFQSFSTENICTPSAKKASYQKKENGKENQFEMLKRLELNEKKLFSLNNYSKKKKIKFLLSVFDLNSLKIIKKLKSKYIKIPSGEITNMPLIKEIGKLKLHTIVSTGMSNIKEIGTCLKVLRQNGLKNSMITLLQCNSEYPSPLKDLNLNAINQFKKLFKCKVGFSDHSQSLVAPAGAVAIGASIIEKHLTLNKNENGPDHFASLNANEFLQMVNNIREIDIAKGSYFKKITKSEKKNLKVVRKSIVALNNIKKGEFFSEFNLTTKRPGTGISPIYWDKLIGKRAKKNYKKNQFIKLR